MCLPFHSPLAAWSIAVLASLSSLLHAAEPRVFTDRTGRSFKAELVSFKGSIVILKHDSGQTFTMSLSNFSDADHQFLRQQKTLAETAPRSGTSGQEPAPAGSVIIEALIDGPSELRVKKDGIYWINGGNAKPGRHLGEDAPTYVDGKAWRPNWKEPKKDRGVDQTSTKSVDDLDPLKIEFKLLNVTPHRGESGITNRDPVKTNLIDGEYSIYIPDLQGGSMWYRFALVRKQAP
ncbi:hypothetical protein SAMN02745166_02900 [Prosthecobacter debontii]|uniref:SLA1 homology domain-containing protein n=1 Tax=Prosthecobacter debontii TaxID=48467 RepID=A0A1T4YBT3_9BACT|nr:hypothetical protein SAMN02745166_02900 [Prosthecobacter debontii]